MKNKINMVLSLGACALCMSLLSLCPVDAAPSPRQESAELSSNDAGRGPRLRSAAQPRVQVGVVAQRYPWNGMVDVKVKVSGVTAESGATLTIAAAVAGATALPATSSTPDQSVGSAPRADRETITVATVTGVKDGERTVTFNANDFDALKGKKLKDVKIAAKVE